MKIKLLKNYTIHERGAVVDFDNGVADALIRRGVAERVEDTKALDAPPRDKAIKRPRRSK